VEWKALSRQFRADWLELLFIIVVGPLIGLGMGCAARMFAPAISAAIR
jgi:hypothetical protein